MTDPFAPKSSEPASILMGSFSAWCLPVLFEAVDYSVSYFFKKSLTTFELVGVRQDTGWLFEANSAFTSTLLPGRMTADLVVTRLSDGEKITLSSSSIHIFTSDDERTSHSQIMVDKIESILQNRADDDVDSYTIKSRSISKMGITELIKWRDYYLAELGREVNQITGRRPQKNTVKVAFR